MTDTDFLQPDLGSLRAAAEAAELSQAVSGLVSIDGRRLAGSCPLAPLARGIARPVTEAGLPVRHCARHHPLYRLGGVCLLAVPAGLADGRAGIAVSWTAHNLLLLDWDRYGTCTCIRQAMNTAPGGVLRAFGDLVTPFGSGGAWLVTGRRNGGGTMTALALAPDTRTGWEPVSSAGVDGAIRVSTAIAVLAVAGVAAYVSYWHAYAVVCAHGETGITARLEPATIDGLVYASSMVNLYAARHRLPVPALARWLLALGIVATLAANMAQGWSHGPVGAVIAAWPAVSLVGSYELLVWIIRTAAAGDLVRGPAADQGGPRTGHDGTSLRLAAAQGPDAGPGNLIGQETGLTPGGGDGALPVPGMADAGQSSGSDRNTADQADQMADQFSGSPGPVTAVSPDGGINAAAVAAYHASLQAGRPLSERKLAGQFGKTSRRWARNRMAEARQSPVPV